MSGGTGDSVVPKQSSLPGLHSFPSHLGVQEWGAFSELENKINEAQGMPGLFGLHS